MMRGKKRRKHCEQGSPSWQEKLLAMRTDGEQVSQRSSRSLVPPATPAWGALRPTSCGFSCGLGLHVRRAHKASLHLESQGASSHTKPWVCQTPCSQDTSSLERHLRALRPCVPHSNKALLPVGHDGHKHSTAGAVIPDAAVQTGTASIYSGLRQWF